MPTVILTQTITGLLFLPAYLKHLPQLLLYSGGKRKVNIPARNERHPAKLVAGFLAAVNDRSCGAPG